MTKRSRSFGVLAAALLVTGCAADPSRFEPQSTELAAGATEVPTHLVRHLPLVAVDVNGQGPFLFVLDTGAEATVISTRLARALQVRSRNPRLQVIGADGATVEAAGTCRLEELHVGEARFNGVDACILDLEGLRQSLDIAFDGILGFGLFRDCLLTVDYPRHRIVMSPAPGPVPEGEGVVSFMRAGQLPEVEIDIGGTTVPVVVDSGSGETIALPTTLAGFFGFKSGPVDGHRATTITGRAARNRIARLEQDVILAGHVIRQPLVFLTEGPGRIGGAVLRHFRVTFDQRRQLVRFDRAEPTPLTTPGFRSAGLALRAKGGSWFVTDVVPGTLAATRGVQPGDRVDMVNGHHAATLTPQDWSHIQTHEDALNLTLRRGQERLHIVLPLEDIVP